MLAFQPKSDRSLQLRATDVSNEPQAADGLNDAGVEGVIFYNPHGEGYVLYASSPSNEQSSR